MKKIVISLIVLLSLLLLIVYWAWSKYQAVSPVVATTASKAVQSEDFVQTPLPTIAISSDLKQPFSRQILDVLNMTLSQGEDSSQGTLRRRWGRPLFQLRKALYSRIEEKLKETPPRWKTLAECQAEVRREVQASLDEVEPQFQAAVNTGADEEFVHPLKADGVTLEDVNDHTGLVLARINLEVNCGTDQALYLFQKKGSTYQLVLRKEDSDPKSTGLEALGIDFSPLDAVGGFYMVLTWGHPWCTSCWGGLTYQALRLGPDPDHPVTLLDHNDSVYRCGGNDFKLDMDHFRITFTGSQSLDSDVLFRTYVRDYKVGATGTTLVGPLGNFPEDFLDEWIKTPWDVAQGFCPGADQAKLKDFHEKLEATTDSAGFDFINPCPKDPARWEIGVKYNDKTIPTELFFEIEKKDGLFLLEDIRRTRSGACPGEAQPTHHPVSMG